MKLLLTRPERDAGATAARLVVLGYEVVVAPVTEIINTGNGVPSADFTAVLATSGNALRALDAESILLLQDAPLHCVGEKTAKIARDRGFRSVIVGGGSGEKLVEDIKATYPPGSHFLYLTGSPRKPIVERGLRASNFAVTSIELYCAQPVADWPGQWREDIEEADVALHFSRASVEMLLDCTKKAGLLTNLCGMRHLCLSEDVAAPLKVLGIASVEVASQASEDHLIAMI
jgi:uroporphyrinogen-III synthase